MISCGVTPRPAGQTATIRPGTIIELGSRNGGLNHHLSRHGSPFGFRFMSAADPRDRTADQEHDAPERVRDPVCGMRVDPTTTPHRAEHAGRPYFFCGAKCRERFVVEPARYLSEDRARRESAATRSLWTCPM